ncbi:MAG: hypothetical protein WA869_21850 [Alloacidobacterium sp.]
MRHLLTKTAMALSRKLPRSSIMSSPKSVLSAGIDADRFEMSGTSRSGCPVDGLTVTLDAFASIRQINLSKYINAASTRPTPDDGT